MKKLVQFIFVIAFLIVLVMPLMVDWLVHNKKIKGKRPDCFQKDTVTNQFKSCK